MNARAAFGQVQLADLTALQGLRQRLNPADEMLPFRTPPPFFSYPLYRRNASTALWPPKPIEFDNATFTFASRASLGT